MRPLATIARPLFFALAVFLCETALRAQLIPDAHLESAVRSVLRIPDGASVTKSDLEALTHLQLREKPLRRLDGLQFATNLQSLDFSYAAVRELGPLASLPNLKSLNAWQNPIASIEPLRHLTSLQSLALGVTEVSDLSPLNELTNLFDLTISGTQVKSLEGIPSSLRSLTARTLTLTNSTALLRATNLTTLDLSHSRFEFQDLSAATNLTRLLLDYTGLTNLNLIPLSKSLLDLSAVGNRIIDISPRAALTNLLSLDLSENDTADLSPLGALVRLTYLDLSRNYIESLAPLTALQSLTTLSLNANSIRDPEPLLQIASLRHVGLVGNLLDLDGAAGGQIAELRSRGVTISAAAQVTAPPQVSTGTLMPIPTYGAVGGFASLFAHADSSNLRVQWFKNNEPLERTGDFLHLDKLSAADSGAYHAVARNPLGAMTSIVKRLIVLAPATNDSFENRQIIPATNTPFAGQFARGTIQPGEPLLRYYERSSLWWRWNAPRTAHYEISNASRAGRISVYRGSTLDTLDLFANSDDRVLFEAIEGETYQIQVVGSTEHTFDGEIREQSPAPRMVLHPSDSVVRPGAALSISGSAFGREPLRYRWFKNNQILSNTQPTLALNASSDVEGFYHIVVSNSFGAVTSRAARVTIAASTNDDFSNADVIPQSGARVSKLLSSLTSEPGETSPDSNAKSAWWRWTAPSNGVFTLNAQGSYGHAAVHTGSAITNLGLIASGDARAFGLHFEAEAGETYFIALYNYGGINARQIATVAVKAAQPQPQIEGGPGTILKAADAPVELYSQIGGLAPINLQWRLNGAPLFGETNSSILRPAAAAGDYDLVASNAHGSATSAVTRVMITNAPANDSIESAIEVVTGSVFDGTLIAATPDLAIPTEMPGTVWWRWSAPPNGGRYDLTVSLSANSRARTLNVYAGATAETLQLVRSVVLARSSEFVTFQAVPGMNHYIEIRGYPYGDPHLHSLIRLRLSPAVSAPRVIDHPPGLAVVTDGSSPTLTLRATGEPPLRIHWFKDGQPLPPSITPEVLRLENARPSDAGIYHAEISNPHGVAATPPTRLIVIAPTALQIVPESVTTLDGLFSFQTVDAHYGDIQIESSEDLETWTPRDATAISPHAAYRFVEDDTISKRRFYRVRVQP